MSLRSLHCCWLFLIYGFLQCTALLLPQLCSFTFCRISKGLLFLLLSSLEKAVKKKEVKGEKVKGNLSGPINHNCRQSVQLCQSSTMIPLQMPQFLRSYNSLQRKVPESAERENLEWHHFNFTLPWALTLFLLYCIAPVKKDDAQEEKVKGIFFNPVFHKPIIFKSLYLTFFFCQ